MFLILLNKFILMAFFGALFFMPPSGSGVAKIDSAYFLNKYFVRAALRPPAEQAVVAPTPRPIYVGNAPAPAAPADAFFIMDMQSGTALLEASSTKSVPIASLTKLMTALVFCEGGFDPEETVIVRGDDRVGGNIEYFFPGDKVKLKDLLAASLIASSNTATNILAKHQGGNNFTELLNRRARLLNLTNSRFVDPTGLDPANVSTAREVARIASRAFGRPEISEILTQQNYEITVQNTGRKINLKNTDRLLGSDLDQGEYKILGGKTGYLDESGYNLAIRVLRGRDEIIIVILGSKSKMSRFAEAKNLALWAFENFRWP